MQIDTNSLAKYNQIHKKIYGFYLSEQELQEHARRCLELVKLSIEKPVGAGSSKTNI